VPKLRYSPCVSVTEVPLDGLSSSLKIGTHSKPEKNLLLSVSAVQPISSSPFEPLCDGSYCIKPSVCLPLFITVRRGHLLSTIVMSGELLCCETYTMLKVPALQCTCWSKVEMFNARGMGHTIRTLWTYRIMTSCSKEHHNKAAIGGSLGPFSLIQNYSKPDMIISYYLIYS